MEAVKLTEKGTVGWAQAGAMCKNLKGPTNFGRVWVTNLHFYRTSTEFTRSIVICRIICFDWVFVMG
jgi:hypothetical protein